MRAGRIEAFATGRVTAGAPAPRDRLASAMCVIGLHALLGLALLRGFEVRPPERGHDPLRIIDLPVVEAVPPYEPPAVPERDDGASEGDAPAPASDATAPEPPASRPLPRVKPRARALPSRPVAMQAQTAVPVAEAAGGVDTGGGDAAQTGGGSGSGAGGAGSGDGAGYGGGAAIGARQRGGRLVNADYPRAARLAGAEGTVFVRFTVGADGRARGCAVTRSSGNAELDATTCRLIERRFRYDPARDAEGRPVTDVIVGRQRWWLERDEPPPSEIADTPPAEAELSRR